MKWGSVYTPDYVNVLHNATKKNLRAGYRFICLTDSPKGLSKEIEIYPIPDIGCTPSMWTHGAWPKLAVFQRDLFGLKGKALFIDLDTVIWGDLNRFFEKKEPFVAIDTGPNWHPQRRNINQARQAGTGLFVFEAGQQEQILERFMRNPEAAAESSIIEQVWVQEHAKSIDYWPKEWVISFKRWLRRPIGIDLFLPPLQPNTSVSVVAFHGDPRPLKLITSKAFQRWDKFPHMGHGSIHWMRNYWLDNGGMIE
jgi:hypothetical protein